jgi:hypothetical protein
MRKPPDEKTKEETGKIGEYREFDRDFLLFHVLI